MRYWALLKRGMHRSKESVHWRESERSSMIVNRAHDEEGPKQAVGLLLFAHLLMSEALFAGLADFYALPPLAVQDLVRCYSTLRGWVQDAVNNIAAARPV